MKRLINAFTRDKRRRSMEKKTIAFCADRGLMRMIDSHLVLFRCRSERAKKHDLTAGCPSRHANDI